MKNKWRVLVLMLSLALVLAACGNGGSSEDGDLGKKILTYLTLNGIQKLLQHMLCKKF